MLDEVIKETQGIEVKENIDVQIDLNVTSYIPDEYIKDSSQKIEIYQNIALCKNEHNIQNVIDEIIDRYGNMPKEIESLMQIARIKYLCKELNISKVSQKQENILLTFENGKFNFDISELITKYKDKIKFSPGVKPMITIKINKKGEKELVAAIVELLKTLKNMKKCDITST